MRQLSPLQLLLGAVLVLLLIVAVVLLIIIGYNLLGVAKPTALPTLEFTATVVPTMPTAMPSATAAITPTLTATVTGVPSATPTATQVPPMQTATTTPQTPPPTPTRTTVPPTATRTPTPPVTIVDWRGDYFANISLQSPPKLTRNDRVVDFSFAPGVAPAPGMPSENWSARWSRNWSFSEGNYRFHLVVDDGARLWVAGRLLIDAWVDGSAREYTGDLYLKGNIPIQLDYYNHLAEARVRLNWEQISQFGGWKGSYFAVPDLSGLPVFQRDDPVIDFNWGTGSPRSDLPVDNFSVRWERRLNFGQAGPYRFRATADDGVRLWVDGQLLIDQWHDGSATYQAVMNLTAGVHDVRVDYYEHLGGAAIQLTWAYEPVSATPTFTPTNTPTPTRTREPQVITDTPTPTPTNTSAPPTDTPTPTPTNIVLPPTDTPTPTPTESEAPPTDTPTPTPTESEAPPTETPTPTETSIPVQLALVLQPDTGPIGVPFAAIGTGWPVNTAVDLSLVRPVSNPGVPTLMAQVISDGAGAFSTDLVIPTGQGWEGLASAIVQAQSTDGQYRVQANYRLTPQLTQVRFDRVPTDQERFALPQPTYLVLDSEAAWTKWFGEEPPQLNPPLNWQRDLVIGAFLGQQPVGTKVDMGSIVQRETTVSAWLTAVVPEVISSPEGETIVPRVMVRVARNTLLPPGQEKSTGLIFAFLDATGRLLAQGPAGAEALQPAAPAVEARSMAAPAPKEGLGAAAPAESAAMEAAAPVTGTLELTAAATVAEAPAAPAAATVAPTEEAPPAQTSGVWLVFAAWVVVALLLAVGVALLVRWYLRSRK